MPDEQVLRNEEDREVLAALSRLRRTDREVIQLAMWEELSASDIAIVLGISRAAVDQRFTRAKKRLAHQLEGDRFFTRSATQFVAKEGGGA
jgi:RNA polymerase sigma-70 factor (ECF subfamily)